MMIELNDWDMDQISKIGYVEYMNFVVMTKEKLVELIKDPEN